MAEGTKKKRVRKLKSVTDELVRKSRESALAAVQIFNNPSMVFKAESYVMLMIVAWTYLMHAYYRSKGIEYRYCEKKGNRRKFDRTKYGAYKRWELERCLNDDKSPIDRDTRNNLLFMIGLRHEIEHQMTTRIDDVLSARFQACCLNFNEYIKKLFGSRFAIEKHLSFSLQFSGISMEQKNLLEEHPNLPQNIHSYIKAFDSELSLDEFGSPRYAYRLLFVPKTVNHKGQADRVIEFVKSDSLLASQINKEYAVIKEIDKKKYLPKQIVEMMQKEGFAKFRMYEFAKLWQSMKAKSPEKGFGTMVAGKTWYWYEGWVSVVREHCQKHKDSYRA